MRGLLCVKGKKVQAAASAALRAFFLFPPDLVSTFRARLPRLFPELEDAESAQIERAEVHAATLRSPPAWRNAIIKTLSGAWTTDRRFQQVSLR
eukprot:6975368-Pyramimonas_sp.AAC.1